MQLTHKRKTIVIVAEAIVGAGIVLLLLSTFMKQGGLLDKYENHKDFEKVRAALEENMATIEKNPKHDLAYYSLGQGLYGLGGYDDAVWAMKKALEIRPDIDYYWTFLGRTYQMKKDYPAARDAYIKALELAPNKQINYTNLAWLYYFRLDSEKEKAYEVLKRGLEKFPNDKDILFDITRYYLYDENKIEFLKYAPKYVKIDPTNELINSTLKKWR